MVVSRYRSFGFVCICNLPDSEISKFIDFEIVNFLNCGNRFEKFRCLVVSRFRNRVYITMYMPVSEISNFLNSRNSFQRFRSFEVLESYICMCT